MTLDEAIEMYASNAEYERTHGNLQGCLDFRQLEKWVTELKQLREQTRWIPCSERLPEEYKRVLVSDSWSGVYVGQYIDTEESWGGKHFINEYGMRSNTVEAWQPLPQPYKAEGSDEE